MPWRNARTACCLAHEVALCYPSLPLLHAAPREKPRTSMAGLDANTPHPTAITLHQQSRVLELTFSDGLTFRLPYEFLRVYSPSAEVRGHGPGQETLQMGKRDVTISEVESVGHYAIRPSFSDGHTSGIYAWDYLHDLGLRQDELWDRYLQRLAAAGASREAVAGAIAAPRSACSK